MKRIWLAASAAVVLAAPAMAADLGVYAKTPALAPAYGWSGFYAGLNAGYAQRNSDPAVTYIGDPTTNAFPATLPPLRGSNFTGGMQAGYNSQRGRWLLGGEVDFGWLGARSEALVVPFWVTDIHNNDLRMASRYDWLATARLRAGVLVTSDLLLYATGGLAVTQVTDSEIRRFLTFSSTTSWGETRALYGAAIGGGLEYAIAPNWSVKAEYLHVAFNKVDPQWTQPGVVVGAPVNFAHSLDLVRLGLNYRWNSPSALQANASMDSPGTMVAARWSGLYAGVHAGYAVGSSNPFSTADVQHGQLEDMATLPGLRAGGALGGVQVGHNWKTGAFVFGGEVDFSALRARSEATISPLYIGYDDVATFSSSYHWLATARLRAGIVPIADLLLYATGGLAVARVTDTASDTYLPPGGPLSYILYSSTSTLFGGAIGGGFEYALAPNWSFKAEYLYAAFNKTAPRTATVGFLPPFAGFDHNLNIVRAGINYQFGG